MAPRLVVETGGNRVDAASSDAGLSRLRCPLSESPCQQSKVTLKVKSWILQCGSVCTTAWRVWRAQHVSGDRGYRVCTRARLGAPLRTPRGAPEQRGETESRPRSARDERTASFPFYNYDNMQDQWMQMKKQSQRGGCLISFALQNTTRASLATHYSARSGGHGRVASRTFPGHMREACTRTRGRAWRPSKTRMHTAQHRSRPKIGTRRAAAQASLKRVSRRE